MRWAPDRFAARRHPTAPASEPEPAEAVVPPRPSPFEVAQALRARVEAPAAPALSVDQLQARDARELAERTAIGLEHIRRGIKRRGCWFPGDG